jgi:mRNA interferase HigB
LHVISRKKLREFWAEHPDAEMPLSAWFKAASHAEWRNFSDVRNYHRAADYVEGFTVFDIGGNKYRLITEIFFDSQVILVRYVLPHADYDKGLWKKRPGKSSTSNGRKLRQPKEER